jgi:hypothetical protein
LITTAAQNTASRSLLTTAMSTQFSLDRFESQVHAGDYDAAHEEFAALLDTLRQNRGGLGIERFAKNRPNPADDEAARQTLQRIADAFTALLSAPEYALDADRINVMF